MAGVEANPVTRNVLIRFRGAEVDERSLVAALARFDIDGVGGTGGDGDEQPATLRRATLREGPRSRRVRIAVRGLDRDPDLSRRVVERLERRPEVSRVMASPVTGRVLIELAHREVDLEPILEDITDLELPELPGEDLPRHPLDPAPLIQSSARLIGSSLGLGLLAMRHLVRADGPPVGGSAPAAVAGAAGVVEGMVPLERRIESALGRDATHLLLGAVSIVSLTFSGNFLGLVVAGTGALGLVSEVRARRSAWRAYENRVSRERVHPGETLRLDPGDSVPLRAEVLDGVGRAVGPDGATLPAAPGRSLPAGARVYGQPLTVRLGREPPFASSGRRHPAALSSYERYVEAIVPVSLAYGALLGVVRRSVRWGFTGLLLVNPRAALIGVDQADNRAAAYVLRCGVTVVGTRRGRPVRRPDALVLGCPRTLTDGLEVGDVIALDGDRDRRRILEIAGAVAGAAGSPWGPAFATHGRLEARDGSFDGAIASAAINGERWTLRSADDGAQPDADRLLRAGEEPLLLVRESDGALAGVVSVRPRLAAGIAELRDRCARWGVELVVVDEDASAAGRAIARRAAVPRTETTVVTAVDERQRDGGIVAIVADSAAAAEAFAVADLAVAITSGRTGHFPARADLLAPTLAAVAEVVEAGGRRDLAVRDSVAFSAAANVAGGVLGLRARPGLVHGSDATYIGALGAMSSGWARLRGGRRGRSVAERLEDPMPERWGRLSTREVLQAMDSSATGLTSAQAQARWRPPPQLLEGHGFRRALLDQIRSPLIAVLGIGAGLSLALGAIADVVMIGGVIVANAFVGAWQERQAGRATEALERMTVRTATVLRDGRPIVVSATDVVPGDVIVLTPGARIAGDARVLDADDLEVDEAPLTGESIPVLKTPDGGTDASRVILEGSDVVVGTGRAVVVAVGRDSRMGTLAEMLSLERPSESPLDARLRTILRQTLPVIALGSLLVVAAGTLWGNPLLPQVALGASLAIAAVPEGLPLLARIAEAAVARRLARRRALVRRLAAVETLGRVDVACADKTGTLTTGRLAVRVVAGPDGATAPPDRLEPPLTEVLLAAALASPHPDAAHARSRRTDVAIVEAAERAGLDGRLRATRAAEMPFKSSRGFHATHVDGRVVVKGAAEVIAPRCTHVRRGSDAVAIGEVEREALLARAEAIASDGLRVLMVAETTANSAPEDPQELVALGFIGIADPMRSTVPDAVQRCAAAGVRVVMLTGDHPATARAIAREAGLPVEGDAMLTGADVADLDDEALAERLERASVVARSTPVDKVRIVEALKRRGHVVAMTGDGVNDAPALRLADVGVAMGRSGTEVAREASDVVLADDDFSTMVEALVEGRGFWANMRRSLGLFLGGNLGELGTIAGATVAGLPSPLTARQLLAINLITDVLPATALAVQEPEHRELGGLVREGSSGLDKPLRNDILARGLATAIPSLGAYVVAHRSMSPIRARSVAFASIVTTQLGQTLDLGRVEGRLSRSVVATVAASAAFTAVAIAAPGVSGFLGLAVPGPLGLALVLAATLGAVGLGRALRPRAAPARRLISAT